MKKLSLTIAISTLALVACTQQTPPTTNTDTPSTPPVAAKRAPMEWYAYDQGTDEQGIPQNKLILKANTAQREDLFTTSCAGTTQVTDLPDLADSVAYIQCWWAGGGDQYAVFIGEAEKATIRHRTVDEEAGYGAWEDLKTL